VVRAGYTQADAGVCAIHIEKVGKRVLEQSGKYRVNKNDEESFRGGSGVPVMELARAVVSALAPPAMSAIAPTRG
jgi:hypothetical protein